MKKLLIDTKPSNSRLEDTTPRNSTIQDVKPSGFSFEDTKPRNSILLDTKPTNLSMGKLTEQFMLVDQVLAQGQYVGNPPGLTYAETGTVKNVVVYT